MGAGQTHDEDDALSDSELKRRAKAGVFVVSTRGLVILLLGFAGNVVVARLLNPEDFGVVAIGMSFVLFAGLVSDGGLGAGLIRRREPPSTEELGALSALQLGGTLAMTAIAAAVAVPLGRVGWVTAVMVASMPFVALQFPGRILLERALLYRRLVAVEMSQVLCFQGWAIGTVAAGFGVWGLATATVVRALTGAVVMAFVCPAGLVRPRPTFGLIKPLVGFGLRFQAVNATWLLRDQTLNLCIAAVGGVTQLGLWALAKRLMEVPYLILQSLWRVSFPTLSRLTADETRTARLVQQAVDITSVGMGFVLTTLAASAPGLVPGLFGTQWRDAATVVPGACLGLAIGGVVSVATQGYLYAIGDVRAVLRASLLQAVTWFAVTLPLLAPLGVVSVGLGWFASAVVEALMLGRATTRRLPVSLVRPLLAPVLIGVGSSALGWAVAARGGTVWSGFAGGGCAAVLFTAGMTVADRRRVRQTYGFAADSVHAALSRT
ncbi:oligosaccharide flippase family protein [Streptomyces sp. NBC_01007]|nr:oligosaccharide flippase family protein [Streptomyces sp. NBC_01007]